MDNFDLKKYLVENKVTANSKTLLEAKTYAVNTDAEDYFDYIDTVNEYLTVPQDDLLDSSIDFASIAAILSKHGQLLFEVEIAGLDDTADGIESYYKVTNPEGYVAINKGNAVKLVDRLVFSQANFNVAKDWVRK